VYRQILIHTGAKNWIENKKTEQTGRSPLRRRSSAL
jgi:hypothetical protein